MKSADPPTAGSEELADVLREALEKAVTQIADPELRLYTPAQAADLLGVTKNWVIERIKARRIPCTFVGRFPRFSAQHIRAIASEGEVDPTTRGRRKAGSVRAA